VTLPTFNVPPVDASRIPADLKARKCWAPWRAAWNEKRGKWDKIPVNPRRVQWGLSTQKPESWADFDTAMGAYLAHPGEVHGVGFCMTGITDVVGLDLDGCVTNGVLAPWASEVVNAVNSYTEVSPSGTGLRIFCLGELPGGDWNNHEVGIEAYGGTFPRFLTVTGHALGAYACPVNQAPGLVLAGIRSLYGKSTAAEAIVARAPVSVAGMPGQLVSDDLPDIDTLNLPPSAHDFLATGEHSGDRSRALHSAAVALFREGLPEQVVFSLLAANAFAMDVALSHRRQEVDRALVYLWQHHCLAAKPKARGTMSLEDFEDLTATMDVPPDDLEPTEVVGTGIAEDGGGAGAAPGASASASAEPDPELDGFTVVAGVAATAEGKASTVPAEVKPPRFQIHTTTGYQLAVKRLTWFVRGVLPLAQLGVVFGASGSGKTFYVLDLLIHIALGRDWFGRRVRRAKVLYVVAEGASGFRDRVAAWCIYHGVEMSELDGWLYILGDTPNLMAKDDAVALVSCARSQAPGVELVVLDTMAQVTPGANENSGEDMGGFVKTSRLVGKALNAMVLLVGHSGKDGDRGLRGWSGLKGAMDVELEVVRTREYRAMTVTKLKDGEGEGTEFQASLLKVVTDFDIEDGEVSSCVIVHGQEQSDSDAKTVAKVEGQHATKDAKKRAGTPGRRSFVQDWLKAQADQGTAVWQLPTLVPLLVKACTTSGMPRVEFTVDQVSRGNQNKLMGEILDEIAALGFVSMNGQTLTFGGQHLRSDDLDGFEVLP
jgi:hypothetical protein